ncbi:MAG: hypothetical protein L6R19_19340 [Alphaproteobacteria bacterium]|nr:hypothetical protein [Alphaproteobacteria bacterium]
MSVWGILLRLPAGLDVSQVLNLDNLVRLLAQHACLDRASPDAPGSGGRTPDGLPVEAGFVAFGDRLASAGMAFGLHAQRLAWAFAEVDVRHAI